MFGLKQRLLKDDFDREIRIFLKNVLGFKPKNIFVYRLALTHKSASLQIPSKKTRLNNERLEYLGDAVLSTVVADFLFRKYPYQEEGFMTEMRSKIVSRSNLNRLAQKIGLSQLIQYNKDGNSQPRSMDGDAFEAFVGAIYLDKGYDFIRKILINRVISLYMDVEALETCEWNYKSKLIDWGQRERHKITFEVLDIIENKQKRQYRTQVYIDGVAHEEGIDFSIKAAEQSAAEKTFKSLDIPP